MGMSDIREFREAVLRARHAYVNLLQQRRALKWKGDPYDRRRAEEELDWRIKSSLKELNACKADLENARAVRDASHLAKKGPSPTAVPVSSSYVKNPPWLKKALGR
jgi:hypothetical protein